MMKYLTIIVILCCLIHGECLEEINKENKTFVATKEWQEIPEGQGIPAGLHIRINLETGKKEAKILEEEDEDHKPLDKNAALSVVADAGESSSGEQEDKKSTAKKQKKVKHLDEALQRIGIDYTPKEKVENIIREYRSYEELKKSFESMRKPFKTDAEIILQLIEEFQTSSSSSSDTKEAATRLKTQIQILESFNYLMSQFDNALVFVDKGGLDKVLLPVLVNTTHSPLKVEAMRVLGAMSQNNPRVQIKVFEHNVGSHLSQIIMSSSNTEELSAALYAFSSLLRKFPLAQQRILSTSGIQALMSVLNRDCELKIKIKAIVIIGDLLTEQEIILSQSSSDSYDPLAAAQYSGVHLKSWLNFQNYCESLENLINKYAIRFLNAPDFLEYIINSLNSTNDLCITNWSNDSRIMELLGLMRKKLLVPKNEYNIEVSQLLYEFLLKVYGDDYRKYEKTIQMHDVHEEL